MINPDQAVDPIATDKESPASIAKNPAAVALGRLGGLKGGPARAKKLTAAQRSEIARKAARARWGADAQGHEPEVSSGTVIT